MPIKKSIRILLIMTSMIPVVFVSVIAHGLLTGKLVEVNTQSMQRTAEISTYGLEAILVTHRTEVTLLAIQDELYNYAKNNNKLDVSSEAVNTFLQTRCKSYEHCERLSLYNMKNEVIACSDPHYIGKPTNSDLTLTYMAATKKEALAIDGLKPYEKEDTSIYTLEIGAPIIDSDSGTVIGYVISTLDTNFLNSFLNSVTVGETGFSFLLDKDGIILYHPDVKQVGQVMVSQKLTSIMDNYNKGFIGESGAFKLFFENTNQIYGYHILQDMNWILFVKQDIPEINSITTIMLSTLTYVCVILLFVIVIIAQIVAKSFSTPIIALRDAMRIASDGNLTVQSNIRQNNELGELSKNFNKMLHIIKTNYEDLESMHEELLSNEEQLRSNYDHIEFLAYHDTLTNLPNKLAFLNYVNAVLDTSAMENKIHAVYFVDLDNFKIVNDTLGHEYGDSLLVKTAQLLTSLLGNNGILARAGGDEFLLFYEEIPSKEYAVEFATQIINIFQGPLDLEGEIVYVSMSIGISMFPENGLTSRTLIKNSDIAMYKSKDTGKNKFTLFDATMEEELNRNTLIVEILRNAIENEEIYIHYQPLMELETNNVIGFEALMRIKSDRLGQLSPSEFIPIAEESGLIIELSSWLLREACIFNKQLIDSGTTPRPVSVNISSVQINRPGFVTMLSKILEETQLPPQYLELEITESTLVSSIMDAKKLLNSLQQLGVRVSLDDFGTGYSSLNYLTNLPINTLKIDKSFVDNISFNNKDSCIAETIIQLAHSLDIKVVAEGVEEENQLALLKTKHCDIIQGFIFYPPLHPEELKHVIQEDDLITQCSLF